MKNPLLNCFKSKFIWQIFLSKKYIFLILLLIGGQKVARKLRLEAWERSHLLTHIENSLESSKSYFFSIKIFHYVYEWSLLASSPQLVQEVISTASAGGWLNVYQFMFNLVGGSPGLSYTLVVVKDTACTTFLLE